MTPMPSERHEQEDRHPGMPGPLVRAERGARPARQPLAEADFGSASPGLGLWHRRGHQSSSTKSADGGR